MKPFAKRLLALTSAAAITLTIIPAVHGTTKIEEEAAVPSARVAANWSTLDDTAFSARSRITAANAPITRQELCGMVMDSYRTITGLTDQDLGEPVQVFIDTDDINVRNASQLGLVTSMGAGFFAPGENVTRQDFFLAATALLGKLGFSYIDDISMDLSVFQDTAEISDEARQSVQVLMCIGAIAQEGLLEPNRLITAEEALALLESVAAYYGQWQENPVHPQRYLGEDVAEFALKYVGCRYVSGGQGPRSFDCSGLVYYVYENFGYTLKPNGRNQWSVLGSTISRADLLPGDVLFFSRNGRSSGIFHVGIYIGDGEFVHAANPRKGVIVSGLDEEWYANRYLGAKRAIN